jgi:hypothetical protein
MLFAKDKPGLARTLKEVNERAGWTPFDYMPRLVPNGEEE